MTLLLRRWWNSHHWATITTINTIIEITIFQIEGVTLLLGGWWLESARKGGPDTLPVININPEVGLSG